jgi:hypothetical protein
MVTRSVGSRGLLIGGVLWTSGESKFNENDAGPPV